MAKVARKRAKSKGDMWPFPGFDGEARPRRSPRSTARRRVHPSRLRPSLNQTRFASRVKALVERRQPLDQGSEQLARFFLSRRQQPVDGHIQLGDVMLRHLPVPPIALVLLFFRRPCVYGEAAERSTSGPKGSVLRQAGPEGCVCSALTPPL